MIWYTRSICSICISFHIAQLSLHFFRFQVRSDKQASNQRVRQECNQKPNYVGWEAFVCIALSLPFLLIFSTPFGSCLFFFAFVLFIPNEHMVLIRSQHERVLPSLVCKVHVALFFFLWIINCYKAFQSIFFHYSVVFLPSYFVHFFPIFLSLMRH